MKNKLFILISLSIVIAGFIVFSMSKKTEIKKEQDLQPAANLSTLIRFHSVSYGNAQAKVTVVEFFDPECESCREMHPIMKRLIHEYGHKVRFVYRYMPLHHNSLFAAAALEEARELNKFDEALDLLFEHQPIWGSHANPQPELIVEYLHELGIPKSRLKLKYLLEKHSQKIEIDKEDGMSLGAQRTPTIFVSGKQLHELGEAPLREAIEQALAK